MPLATLGALGVPVLAAAGLGTAPAEGTPVSEEAVRRTAGAASRTLAGRSRVALTLASAGGAPTPGMVQAAGEGALFGAYRYSGYRAEDQPAPPSELQRLRSRGRGGDDPGPLQAAKGEHF